MSARRERYEGEVRDEAVDLLARIREVGLLPDEDEHADIAYDVEVFLERWDPEGHLTRAPRCPECGARIEIESWDTPVEHCPNDCVEDAA